MRLSDPGLYQRWYNVPMFHAYRGEVVHHCAKEDGRDGGGQPEGVAGETLVAATGVLQDRLGGAVSVVRTVWTV